MKNKIKSFADLNALLTNTEVKPVSVDIVRVPSKEVAERYKKFKSNPISRIDVRLTDKEIKAGQAIMDAMVEHHNSLASKLAVELNVSERCADDIIYLRTRSRHTQALENELIALHKKGVHPNMCEYGCTKETGEALLAATKLV